MPAERTTSSVISRGESNVTLSTRHLDL